MAWTSHPLDWTFCKLTVRGVTRRQHWVHSSRVTVQMMIRALLHRYMTAKIQIEDTDLFSPGAGAPGDLRRHPPFRRTLSGCHAGNRSDSQGVAVG